MALRLVLVSAVAGLGLSVPTRTQLETWTQSAQLWVTARLAAWDAQMPAGEDAFVYIADSAPPLPQPVTAKAPAPVTTATSLARPTARHGWPTATELACQTDLDLMDGMRSPTESTEFDTPVYVAPPQPVAVARPAVAARPTAPVVARTARPTVNQDAPFRVAMNAVVASFAADLPSHKTPATPAIVKSEPRKPMASPKIETKPAPAPAVAKAEPKKPAAPISTATTSKQSDTSAPNVVGDQFLPGIALALDLNAVGLNPAVSGPAPMPLRPAPARLSPSQVPVLVGSTLYPNLTQALTRQAKVSRFDRLPAQPHTARPVKLAHSAPAAQRVPADDRLDRAMRLTREAVFAWANLLNGPAVVTISH